MGVISLSRLVSQEIKTEPILTSIVDLILLAREVLVVFIFPFSKLMSSFHSSLIF